MLLSNNSYAVALYDNEAESDDELTFKKADLIHVLNVDYMDMEGWCLCKLVKTGQVGLAAGNRLKSIQNQRILAKLNKTIGDQVDSRSAKMSTNTSSIISVSSSTCSISSSSSNSFFNSLAVTQASGVIDATSDTQSSSSQSVDSNESKTVKQASIAPSLPPKKRIESKPIAVKTGIKTVRATGADDDDYDYYDYAIPRNNQPIKKEEKDESPSSSLDHQTLQRKSLSSTIDSGISTSSLVSLTYSTHNLNSFEAASSSSKSNSIVIDEEYSESSRPQSSSSSSIQPNTLELETNKRAEFEADFCHKLDRLKSLSADYATRTPTNKEHNFLLKFMSNFLTFNLKQVKTEHACFHPNLNVYNRFKSLYSDMKELYTCYDKWVNSSTKSEESVCFEKLFQLVEELEKLINETRLFSYHSQTSIEVLRQHQTESPTEKCVKVEEEDETYDNYQYVYDNLSGDETYDNNDYSDYCEIGDVVKPVEFEDKTLTKNNTTVRLNMSDLMLLRFYLKHVDEYLTEMSEIYSEDTLHLKLKQDRGVAMNKLALYGHKLVFICDTLERNLSVTSNDSLKLTLSQLSSLLSETLKVYAVRIKQLESDGDCDDQGNKRDELVSQIGQSMHEMLSKSSQIRQLIVTHIC